MQIQTNLTFKYDVQFKIGKNIILNEIKDSEIFAKESYNMTKE